MTVFLKSDLPLLPYLLSLSLKLDLPLLPSLKAVSLRVYSLTWPSSWSCP